MEKEDKLKFMYEQSSQMHYYVLNWRYKLFAGHIAIVSALGYFLFTKSCVYLNSYLITCIGGLLITIVFFILNVRNTKLTWHCKNNLYKIEQELGFHKDYTSSGVGEIKVEGLYSRFVNKAIQGLIDTGKENNDGQLKNHFKLMEHTGSINWYFLVAALFFTSLITYWLINFYCGCC